MNNDSHVMITLSTDFNLKLDLMVAMVGMEGALF